MAHASTVVSNDDPIVIPRTKLPTAFELHGVNFINKFGGQTYVLDPKSKKRSYIKIDEVIDQQFVNDKENLKRLRSFLSIK